MGSRWAIGIAAASVALGLTGCSGPRLTAAELSASASPSATAAAMDIAYGVDEIDVAVGQRVDFLTPGEVTWTATSSDEAVFDVISPTEDFFTPNTPGGIAQSPGVATATMTPPTNGAQWSVTVRVIGPTPAASSSQ